MRIFCLALLLIATANAASGQIQFDKASIIPASDPILPILEARQAEIQKQYEASDYALAHFSKWISTDSPVTAKLFPKLRFASVQWGEYLNPKAKPLPAHDLAMGMELTVTIDTEQMIIIGELMDSGNQKEFGKLLAKTKIRITNESDAELVWNAFCELTHKHWESYPAIKITDSIWHLGDTSIDNFHYFYEVLLDQNQIIQSGELKAVEINKAETK